MLLPAGLNTRSLWPPLFGGCWAVKRTGESKPSPDGMKMSVALEPATMTESVQFRNTVPGATDMAIVPVYVGLARLNNYRGTATRFGCA